MKRFIVIIIPILTALSGAFISCSNDNNNIESNEENGLYNDSIIGQWHFYSDSLRGLIGDTTAVLFDQILTFNSVGNFTEENIIAIQGSVYNGIWSQDSIYNGNWSIKGNKITINNWEGKKLDNSINIISLSNNRLEISYSNFKAVYLRVGTEFRNINQDILGYWYNLPNMQNNTSSNFLKDSTVIQRSLLGFNIYGEEEYKWNFKGDTLSFTSLPVMYTSVYIVKYCNDKYMHLKSINFAPITFGMTDFKRN